MIIAVDFDGTLCRHAYPMIGTGFQHIVEALIQNKKDGDKLILWTCRTGDKLQEAVDWCSKRGLWFDAVNEDLLEIKDSDFGRNKSAKIFADIYLDDRNITIEQFIDKIGVG